MGLNILAQKLGLLAMRRKYLMRILFETDLIAYLSHLMKKPTKWHEGPAKTQISLGIRPVWSVFAVRMKKAWVLSYPLSAQQRLWSDWADAQADLSLRWAHMQFCWFCHDTAHIPSLKRLYVSWHSISGVSHMVEPPLWLREDEGIRGGLLILGLDIPHLFL